MECFLAQMRVQKGEILERLSSARNFSNMDDEDNYCAANKALRQVSKASKAQYPVVCRCCHCPWEGAVCSLSPKNCVVFQQSGTFQNDGFGA